MKKTLKILDGLWWGLAVVTWAMIMFSRGRDDAQNSKGHHPFMPL
ncbi:hypothetical protein AALA00_13670 [Lachnospiraceae bacterium 46-15]